MKAAHIIAAVLVSVLPFGALAQSDKCTEAFKKFEGAVLSHEYNDALVQYKGLSERCSKVDEKLYQYGEKVYAYLIEASQSEGERQKLIDGLFELYAAYDKTYPSNANANLAKKALVLKNYQIAGPEEQYKLLDKSFADYRSSFTDYNAIETLFLLSVQQQETGKLNQSQFIERYGALSAQVNFAKAKLAERKSAIDKKSETAPVTDDERLFLAGYDAQVESLDAVRENMDILAGTKLACSDLDAYYSTKLDASLKDASWLESAVTVMSSNKCFNTPVTEKAARALYDVRPDMQSAYLLATVLLRKGKGKEAATYFDKAAALEKNAQKKAELYYTMASIYRNIDKKQAKEHVLRSAALNPKSGKPYLFLAEMYSSVTKECQFSDFDRKALMWLAADAAKKAMETEPKNKATSTAMIESYVKRAPNKAELKAAGKRKGDQITFGCWINESVTVPNL